MPRLATVVIAAVLAVLAAHAGPGLQPLFAVEREFLVLALAFATTLPLLAVLSVLSVAAQR